MEGAVDKNEKIQCEKLWKLWESRLTTVQKDELKFFIQKGFFDRVYSYAHEIDRDDGYDIVEACRFVYRVDVPLNLINKYKKKALDNNINALEYVEELRSELNVSGFNSWVFVSDVLYDIDQEILDQFFKKDPFDAISDKNFISELAISMGYL